MNEDIIADLKQFISATLSQHVAGLATKDDMQRLGDKLAAAEIKLTNRIDKLEIADLETLNRALEAADGQVPGHG